MKVFKVLKNVEVSSAEAVAVGPGGGVSLSSPAVSASSAGVARQVRIVESNNEYAIIEVTCSCGSKAFVQCNYAELNGTAQQ